jgi:hypothetical protein
LQNSALLTLLSIKISISYVKYAISANARFDNTFYLSRKNDGMKEGVAIAQPEWVFKYRPRLLIRNEQTIKHLYFIAFTSD